MALCETIEEDVWRAPTVTTNLLIFIGRSEARNVKNSNQYVTRCNDGFSEACIEIAALNPMIKFAVKDSSPVLFLH